MALEKCGGAATVAPHFVQKREVSATRGVPQVVQKHAIVLSPFLPHAA